MNGTLFGQQITFTEVSRLTFEGISWNLISGTLLGFLQPVTQVAVGLYWRALYFGNKVHSRQYLGFHSRYFPENPNLSLRLNWLKTISVSLQSAYKEGHFHQEDQLLSRQYICFHSRDFPHNLHLAPYALCLQMVVFCDRPVMKGTLRAEHSTFTVSRLPFEVFSWKSTPSTLHALPTNVLSLVVKIIEQHFT